MRLWNRPDDDTKARVLIERVPSLQRDLQEAAILPGFFERCLNGHFGEELRPEGHMELLFRALDALDKRIEKLEQ